ncbi:MAG: peptide chain release factor-like protein [Candidatus Omnitrophica bacterium]|nr:peptide chain release factor-like protein [Candidatus Omnitrophota bacterium]
MVNVAKEKSLQEIMARLGVREEDIVERFIRAQGPGGQNVNKVSTCVHVRHLPTGIEVKCQQERSQAQNRYRARQLLLKKIENAILGKLSSEQQRIEKIRRQKRKRSRRAKLKILASKRRRAAKKSLRARVQETDE